MESIRRVMHAAPFQPFDIKRGDGSVPTVQHPDSISVPPVVRPGEIAFSTSTGQETDEYQTHWIDLSRTLEVIVPGETGTGSGSPGGEGRET